MQLGAKMRRNKSRVGIESRKQIYCAFADVNVFNCDLEIDHAFSRFVSLMKQRFSSNDTSCNPVDDNASPKKKQCITMHQYMRSILTVRGQSNMNWSVFILIYLHVQHHLWKYFQDLKFTCV